MRVVEPASELCARDGKCRNGQLRSRRSGLLRNDCIVKYSVDPALTDIRGEFPRQAEANLGGNAGCRSLVWGAAAFFISQESASCEIKSLRHDAQLAEKKPARVQRKPEQV